MSAENLMPDVSGLVPEARPIVQQVASVYFRHTAPWFIGLLAHGSAVKGGVIPNCSDIDLQLYLRHAAFTAQGHFPLELGFSIRRDLEGVRLCPFRYLQCYVHRPEAEPGMVGPIPGAYHLVAGKLPVPEATATNLRESARQALDGLDTTPTFVMGKLLGPGGVRLERSLRLLCTKVWPVLYQVLTLQNPDGDPIELWCLPKQEAIERLPHDAPLYHAIRAFHSAVWAYYPEENSLEDALSLIQTGLTFLQFAAEWWRDVSIPKGPQPPALGSEPCR